MLESHNHTCKECGRVLIVAHGQEDSYDEHLHEPNFRATCVSCMLYNA